MMIWPTMKRTPQKLKRPRKEPKPGLKLCKRKRRNLASNFPFPRLRRTVLPELVERPALFLLLLVIFVPKVDTPETFSEAPICVFDAEREVTGPVLAHTKINSCRQDQNRVNLTSQSRASKILLAFKESCAQIFLFGMM